MCRLVQRRVTAWRSLKWFGPNREPSPTRKMELRSAARREPHRLENRLHNEAEPFPRNTRRPQATLGRSGHRERDPRLPIAYRSLGKIGFLITQRLRRWATPELAPSRQRG